MRNRKLATVSLSLLFASLFLLNLVPVQAALLPIEPTNPPIKLVDNDELKKIADLYKEIFPIYPTPASPNDEKVMVIASGTGGVAFYNLKTGQFSPIAADVIGSPFFVAIGERRWANDTTLTWLSSDENDGLVRVLYDTVAEKIAVSKPLRLPGLPFSLAPNGRTLLALVLPEDLSGFSTGKEAKTKQAGDLFTKVTIGQKYDALRMPKSPYDKQLFEMSTANLQVATNNLSLVSYDLETGSTQELYGWSPNSTPIALNWAANSSSFALTRLILPEIGRQGNLINELASLDGQGRLAPEKNPFLQGSVVDYVNVNTGKASPALLKGGEVGDIFIDAALSPDGNTLVTTLGKAGKIDGRAYASYNPQHSESSYLRFYDAGGKVITTHINSVIDAPFPLAKFISGDELIITAVSKTDQTLFYLNRISGEFRRLPIPAGAVYTSFLTNSSRQIFFTHSSFLNPPEMFSVNADGSNFKQLTNFNRQVAEAGKVKVSEVNFTLAGGQQRGGYLIQPRDQPFPPANVPVVVWQEGGPYNPFINRWAVNVESPFNMLPQFGYSILFVPLPGRAGFGADFLKGMVQGSNFGQVDINEGAEIARQMISKGWTSNSKLGITGCSYGGYFTSQSLASHPDLYAAGVTQCTLLDLFQEWQFGFSPFVFYLEGGRTPTEIPDEYRKDSPLYNSANIRAATLIFHGTNDFLPIQIAANYHDQLQRNGVAVNLYGYRGEGHGLGSLSSQLSASQLQLLWFRQYLK